MQPAAAMIFVRNKRQAMDWSLVLVSQGVECTIAHDPEKDAWGLVVASCDYARSIDALRLYRAENSRGLRQEIPGSSLIFDWRSALWFLFLTIVYALDTAQRGGLHRAGLMDNQAVAAGEWWRLFTATTLHGDLPHLAVNATTGILLLGLAMGQLGSLALLAAALTGVGGNLAGYVCYGVQHQGLGASGTVLGALGLLTAQSLVLAWRQGESRDLIVRSALAGMLLLILLGFSPDPRTDVLAHVAGFGTGVVLGAGMAWLPRSVIDSAWVNRLCELVCALVFALVWWCALR